MKLPLHTSGSRPRVSLALFLAAIHVGAPPADAQDAFVGRPVLDFEHRIEPAMRMPTAVAVASNGSVFVADGVNDRILQFAADGAFVAEIRRVGDQTLSRPLSVKTDAAGRLWIADSGNARAIVRAPDGSLERTVVLEQGAAEHAPDVTDVAPTGDGQAIWFVDNDNHRLVRRPMGAGEPVVVGKKGAAAGEFNYPFALAIGAAGELFVTDVINARIQVLGASGAPLRSLGEYGVDLGQLYRPKGLALDADGNVWIADGALGVVQVFSPSGGLIDVLRDPDGKPLHLETPTGITFDADGNLYVVELQPGRVRKLSIAANPSVVKPAAQSAPATTTTQGAQRRSRACTICHIDWIEPFSAGIGSRLMDAPLSTEAQPAASRDEACLSCHDGSVVDSRRRVWRDHGHLTGMKPPESMRIPPGLPLVNGRIACRTCHSAHRAGEPEGDLRTAVFLRVDNTASQLCVSCHTDKTRGPELGTHPTGGMPWPVPQELIDAGARVGPNPRELTCQVCHTPHGASYEHLLVLGIESNQLCLECHKQMRPGMFLAGSAEHPLNPKANAEQAAVVEQLGTRLSPDGNLLCISCHKLHHGKGERYMLADGLTDGDMCLRCHSDRQELFGNSHDLRGKFPDEKNRLGMTAHTGGPCSSCHLFHRFARAPEPSDVDPDGHCLTCHQKDRVAQAKTLGPITHPNVKCVVCHDPHNAEQQFFLRSEPEELCLECHDYGDEMTGGHTFEGREDLVNARGQSIEDVGNCLMCHSMHHGVDKPLWAAALEPPKKDEEKCTVCHRSGGMAAAKPKKQFNHTLTCQQCHNPHGDAEISSALLLEDKAPHQLCLQCHDEHETIEGGPHDFERKPQVWPKVSLAKNDRCLACHQPHADEKSRLFTNGLAAGVTGPDAACLACHKTAVWQSDSDVAALHPRTADNLDPDNEYAPVVVLDEENEEYAVGCRTCHNPHRGEGPPAKLLRAEEGEPAATLCLECHDAVEHIAFTGHAQGSLQKAGLTADACKPCHSMHAHPQRVGDRLWAGPLAAETVAAAERRCRGCHRADGPAKPPVIATHPEVPMFASVAAATPGVLTLFGNTGKPDPRGRIGCLTCHLPHGRSPGESATEQKRGMRLEVRSFEVPNLCNRCHGDGARWRYLYFHDPQRRKGPTRWSTKR